MRQVLAAYQCSHSEAIIPSEAMIGLGPGREASHADKEGRQEEQDRA